LAREEGNHVKLERRELKKRKEKKRTALKGKELWEL
jgi:hypothetical protein